MLLLANLVPDSSGVFWGYIALAVVAMVCATVIYIHHSKRAEGEREARRRDEWMNRPLETFGKSGTGPSSGPGLDDIEDRYLTEEERARKRESQARERQARGYGYSGAAGSHSGQPPYGAPGGFGPRDDGTGRPMSRKSKGLAFLLCFFLGGFGAHYFYCERFGMGLLYLLTSGLFGIGPLVDIFRIALDRFPDKDGRYL